ncbi:hypothetical protein OXH62_26860 [Pseudomonas chlororaphis]|uniref:hypothetical protein n=1 Tax=Pseudomonas chlororaphis TaxID=587753 RepID=UPI0035D3F3C5
MDNSTQAKIRDWQLRRLEIKEQMQLHPEKTLELSRVLDLMDEEHAAILSGAAASKRVDEPQQDMSLDPIVNSQPSIHMVAEKCDLQLRVTAENPENLIRLLEMATCELKGKIGAEGASVGKGSGRYPGEMSGTFGGYRFELRINDEVSHE